MFAAGAGGIRDGFLRVSLGIEDAVDLIAEEGGGHVHYWVYEPTEAHTRIANLVGLSPGRDLWQMRVPLPLAETTDLVTRPFVRDQDEAAWLEVNGKRFDVKMWVPESAGVAAGPAKKAKKRAKLVPDTTAFEVLQHAALPTYTPGAITLALTVSLSG